MISCKLEQVGDRFALVLDEGQCQVLNLQPGDTVRLEVTGDGTLRVAESWTEDPHARGRAFLKRLHRRSSAQLL
jgi:antitoxin component of MazEF toxin-antitoxin module